MAHAPARPLVLLGENHTEPPRLLSFPSIYHPAFLVAVLPIAKFNAPRFSESPRAGELGVASINFGYSSSGRPVASDGWPHEVQFFAEEGDTIEVGPGPYREGERLTQRRGGANGSKSIFKVHRFLKTSVTPLAEDPFYDVEDGWEVHVTLNDLICQRQMKTIADDEIYNRSGENSSFFDQDLIGNLKK